MSRVFRKPNGEDFQSFQSLGRMIGNQQVTSEGSIRSTYSITGQQNYAATAYTVSDILQGTINFKKPQDTMAILNKALTGQLEGLVSQGFDGISAFSTTPAPAVTDGWGNTGSGNYSNAFGEGGTIRIEWVESLPSTHESGAVLWSTRGKGGREMHLPTSEDIRVDIEQHRQFEDMKATWKHPWAMDRQGGVIGGEGKIYWDVSEAPSMLGEAATLPGDPGAFGYLSPEDEQFYISMAWPYKGDVAARFEKANRPDIAELSKTIPKEAYRGRKILIYSVKTGKGCVTTPGDWGPHPYYANSAVKRDSINGIYFGLAPDVHFALGTEHGDEMRAGFVDDSVPVGPFTPEVAASVNIPGDLVFVGADGTEFNHSAAEMKYAGKKVLDHPNCLLDEVGASSYTTGAIRVFTEGFVYDNKAAEFIRTKNPDNPSRAFLMPSLLNWLWYILEGGFVLAHYAGGTAFKYKKYNPTAVSNHSKGGAIDISGVGHVDVNGGEIYSTWNLNQSRPICEKLIDYMGTLPKTARPSEIGGPYSVEEGKNGPIRVYYDEGHFHFGFNENQIGKLISPLILPHGLDFNLQGFS